LRQPRSRTIDDEPDTAELISGQRRRELEEARLAEEAAGRTGPAADPGEELAHARRAEEAAYLRAKLEDRERSERDDG
jgi:hypothetical protein